MVIKLLQQSTFRRYAAIVLSPFFNFCCFRCVIMTLTGVINYVFLHLFYVKIGWRPRWNTKSQRLPGIGVAVNTGLEQAFSLWWLTTWATRNECLDLHKPDLVCLSETWIKPTTTSTELINCTPPGYTFISTPRNFTKSSSLSLIHIWRCRRIERCRSRWSPYH